MMPAPTDVILFLSFVPLLTAFLIIFRIQTCKRPARAKTIVTIGGSAVSVMRRQLAVSAAIACVFAAGEARANGTDPTVVAGQAGFSTQGSSLNIINTPGAIINWQGFSIGANETTRFIQQSAASSVLNRVLGPDPSVILGTLTSNGRVFLINPGGILVGQGARIDVAGLVASTLNLNNEDFLAGRLNFASNPLAGRVENQGRITTPSGGNVYLVGSGITNSGIINSPGGDVILAAGRSVKIFDTSTPGVRVELTAGDNAAVNLGEILAQSGEIGIYGAAIRNSGIINADQVVRDGSGKIFLRAKQDVTLEAGSRLSANGERGGGITVQSETGTTLVSGTIEATGTAEAAGTGGTVQLLGNRVGLITANVDASGTTGGGTVLIGGDFQGKNPSVGNASATFVSPDSIVAVDAVTNGNGGKAIVWADDSTRFGGSISARGGAQSGDGGFVEVSGKHYLDFRGTVDTRAPMGRAGTLLLDPDEIHIINAAGGATLAMTCIGGGDCTTPTGTGPYTDTASAYFAPAFTVGILPDHTINQQLALGNVTVQTSTGGIFVSNVNSTVTFGPTTGAVDVAGGNAVSNANTLTLNSATDISWDAPWSYRNLGQLTLLANNGSIAGTGALTLADTSPLLMQATTGIGSALTPMTISGSGGNVTLTAGTSATLGAITTAAGAISATSSGNITVGGALTNTNTGASAVVLNSTSGSGNVTIAGGSISTPGRATIFTNTIAGSSGVTALVGPGSGNFRYNGVTTGLGTGTYAVYTEQPTLTITADSPAAITYGDAAPALTAAISGLQNGDSAAQALSSAATVAVGGATSTSGNYTAGAHTLTPSAVGQLGYALSYVNGTLTISQRALTGSIAAGSSVYGAALSPGAVSFSNVVSGDTVTPAAVVVNTAGNTSSSGNLKAGSYSGIESVGSTLSGTDAANYTFAGAVGNYTVSQLALAVSATGVNKVYDGLTTATATLADNRIAGDLLATDYGTASYLDKNVGNGKTVNVGGITLTGTDAGNYSFNATASTSANITPLAITGSITADNKVYDGTAAATIATRTLSGAIAGDTVSYSGGTALFSDKNAANGKTVTGSGLVLSGADAGNYTVNGTATSTANIIPAPLGIAANSTTKTYGSTVIFTGSEFSSSGLKNGETVGSVSLTSAGAAATAGVAGGPYNIVPSAASGGTFSAGNYSISYTDGALGVTPAPLGIAANSATRLYGDANPAFSATYTGFQNGETPAALTGTLTLTTPAVTTSNVGSYAIIPSGQSSQNYTVAYVNGKLNITPAPLGIAANSATKTYGDTVIFTGSEFSSSGLKNGETIGSVSLASAGAAATASVAGGPYDITASAASGGTFSAGNYSISYTDGTLGVTPAPLGIAANSVTKTYGDAVNFTGTEFSSSGLKNGETVGSVTLASLGAAADADVLGSPYDITVSAASGGTYNAGNYSISYVDGALGVLPAGLLGIAANSAVKTYNGLAFSGGNGVNYTGFRVGDTPASLEGTLAYGGSSQGAVNVGSYTIIPFGQSSPNYTIAYVNGKLSVTPAPLGIAANSATRLYGDANPAFSATYTGFQNGETSSVLTGALTLTTPAVTTSNVGSYAIIPSGQSSQNYTVAYVNGRLNVTPAPLGIAANSATKSYGSTVNFAGSEFSSSGLKNGETVGSVSLTSAGAAATAPVAGGPYDITASAASGGTFTAGNYAISYTDGALNVTPAPLGIAANSTTRLYGDANPAFSATYTGFQNGEGAAQLTGALAFATPAAPASNVGSYAIIPSGQSSSNYTVSYVNGTMRVTPVPLIITADTKSKVYGTNDPVLTFDTTGLVNNPALGVVDSADSVLSGTLTRSGGESVLGGAYTITRGSLAANGNYTLGSFTGSSFTVTPALLAVEANTRSKVYGTSDPVLTYSVAGLANNQALGIDDTAGSVLSGTLTRVPGESVLGGPYAITRGTLTANGNYTLGGFTGNGLVITPAALAVVANPQSKVFGTSDPALTYSVAGLVNNPALGIADSPNAVLSGALTRAPGESALGGPYPITQGTVAANSNYTLGFTGNNLIITGAAAEPVLGFNAAQVVFAGLINNEFYYRPGNFWHISLNPNNADPGFDVMRGTNDLNSRLDKRANRCDSVFGGGFCETRSFPEQFEKAK